MAGASGCRVELGMVAPCSAPPLFKKSSTFLTILAMASGQEVQLIPCWRMVEGQRIPLSWSMISSAEMPERRAMEVRRAVAVLKRFQVIEPLDVMEELDMESRVVIYPSIHMVLMGDDVRALIQTFGEEETEDETE